MAVQPPGRANRIKEAPFWNMESLVDGLCGVVEPWLDKPYVVFGHSLGSRVGFELLHRAVERGWRLPEHYITSGSSAPHVCRAKKRISHLDDAGFVEGLKQFNGYADSLIRDEKFLDLFLPLLRADFNIADTYSRECGSKLDVPFTVFGGRDDTDARPDELRSWESHFTGTAGIRLFDGNHFFIESHREAVAREVSDILRQVLAAGGGRVHVHKTNGSSRVSLPRTST